MPALTRQAYLMAKTETTVGTENAPTLGASVIKTYDTLDFQPISENTNTERRPNVGVIGATEIDVAGAYQAGIKFTTYLTGSGTSGTAPAWAPLMIGCGWQQDCNTVPTPDTVTFKPATAYAPGAWANTTDFTGMDSLTMHCLQGDTGGTSEAKLHKARGCMGDFTLDMEFGKPAKFTWDFKGAYVASVADQTWTAATVSAEGDPVSCQNVGATWTPNGGSAHTMVLRKFSLKNGANVIMRPDMNAANGYLSALITDRLITWSAEVEVPIDYTATAGADWYGHLAQTAAAYGVFEIGTVGSAGNRWALTLAKASFRKVTQQDGDGIQIFAIEGACATSALSTGGDEVTLVLD